MVIFTINCPEPGAPCHWSSTPSAPAFKILWHRPCQRLIIHGKRTIWFWEICVFYEVWLLKMCYFYFLFFREDISVTYKVDGEQRWWSCFGAAPGFLQMAMYSLAACLFSPLCFCCLTIRCEDKWRGYNIMHCETSQDRRNGEDALFQCWKSVFLSVIHAMF